MPSTYTSLYAECEKLSEMAEELAAFASSNVAFSTDPAFDALKARFRVQLQRVASLGEV